MSILSVFRLFSVTLILIAAAGSPRAFADNPFAGIKIHWPFAHLKKETRFEDIRSWKPLGLRFAAGYDGAGKLLAIYDLSYPDFQEQITLGLIGHKQLSVQELSRILDDARTYARESSDLSDEQIDHAVNSIRRIEPHFNEQALFATAWWKNVHWKDSAFSKANHAPLSFRLSDILLDSDKITHALTGQIRKVIRRAVQLSEKDLPLSDVDVLSSLSWVLTPEGYEIRWDLPFLAKAERPRKLADIQEKRAVLINNFEEAALWGGINEILSLIPVPVVQAITKTAVSRLQHFLDLTRQEHMAMLTEMLTTARQGDQNFSPFSALTPEERDELVDAVEYGSGSWSHGLQWFIKDPEQTWDKERSKESECSSATSQWLAAQSQQEWDFSPRFAIGTTADSHSRLYLSSKVCAKGHKKPVVSIDYANPGAEVPKRIFKESMTATVQFASHFVPYVGFVVTGPWSLLVQGPYEKTRIWEARLTHHLEERILEGESAWTNELAILDAQRLNPMEVNRDRMMELIQYRRQQMGF
jgi:hypothetical protein